MTVRAAWLTETGQTREDTRLTLSGLLTANAYVPENIPLKARGGIVPGGFALTGAAGSMTLTIGTGRAFVQGGRDNQGVYPVAVTEPETLTVPDGDAQYSRIDLVELVVRDGVYDGTAETAAAVRLVQGTPAATPVVPNTPDGSALPLYRILVPRAASAGTGGVDWASAVTSLRYPTVALGGIVPAGGFSGAYAGQYREDSGVLQRWDGAAWVPYPKAVGGIAPSTPLLTAGSYTGQYREDAAGLLQRWNGSAWQYAEGRTTILLSASQSTAQTVPSGTWTAMTLNVADVDDAAGWASNVYTVPRAGWWRVACTVSWYTESSAGSRGARIHVNGSGVSRATWQIGAGPGATSVGGTALLKLAAGDKLALYGLQSSGAAMTTLGGSGYYTNLNAEWLRS